MSIKDQTHRQKRRLVYDELTAVQRLWSNVSGLYFDFLTSFFLVADFFFGVTSFVDLIFE